MSHQIFNKKSYAILRQKYNPVKTKNDIGGEKMKREDEIEDEIQYAYCPERNMTWTLIFTSALRKSDIHYLQSYSHSFVVIISFVDKRAMSR